MTAVRGRSAVVGLLFVTGVACADREESGDPQVPDAEGSVGTPVTHDEGSTEDALITGVLQGSLTCLWLEVDGEHHALILPSGSTTRQSGDGVTLLDDGDKVASTGDEVNVTGGFRQDDEPCAEVEATGPVIVAGEVRRSGD